MKPHMFILLLCTTFSLVGYSLGSEKPLNEAIMDYITNPGAETSTLRLAALLQETSQQPIEAIQAPSESYHNYSPLQMALARHHNPALQVLLLYLKTHTISLDATPLIKMYIQQDLDTLPSQQGNPFLGNCLETLLQNYPPALETLCQLIRFAAEEKNLSAAAILYRHGYETVQSDQTQLAAFNSTLTQLLQPQSWSERLARLLPSNEEPFALCLAMTQQPQLLADYSKTHDKSLSSSSLALTDTHDA